jgi:hypothetical protein
MTKKTKNSVANGGQRRLPPTSGQFTHLTAKQAQEASVRARNLRKQVRAQMLETLVNELDFGQEMKKAILSNDVDRVNMLQTALRVIGLTHDQSEDAVSKSKQISATATASSQSTDGDTTNDNAANQTLKLQFEIVDPEPDEDEEA